MADTTLNARGGGPEVGRSCYDYGKFLIDAGIKLGERHSGRIHVPKMPRTEKLFLVLTHGHLDHVGYVVNMAREQPRMRIFATMATKRLVELQLYDSYRIGVEQRKKEYCRGLKPQPLLYEETEIAPIMRRIEIVENENWFIPALGYKMSFRGAGHIRGAAIILVVTPDRFRIVHACDLSLDNQAFVMGARVPHDFLNPDLLTVECTHGALSSPLPHRARAEQKAVEIGKRVWARGGKLLIPQFAIMGPQIADPFAKAGLPIVLDGAMRDCMWIFKTTPHWCQLDIPIKEPLPIYLGRKEDEEEFQRSDLDFRKALTRWPQAGIVACTPGMMEFGLSVQYAEEWLENSKNAILFTGYEAEGTAGRKISQINKGGMVTFHHDRINRYGKLEEWDVERAVHCEVYNVRLSGHSDPWKMTDEFIVPLNPKKIVTVHGSPEAHVGMKEHINRAVPDIEVIGAVNNEPIGL